MGLLNPSAIGVIWLLLVAFGQSMAQVDTKKGHSPKPVHITKELYRQMQIYTNYTSSARYSKANCPNPPYGSKIVSFFSIVNKRTSSQATIYRNDADKEFIVTFPGTNGSIDLMNDHDLKLIPFKTKGVTKANCKGCLIAQGWLREWQALAGPISKAIKAHHKKKPSYKITVTGHSLGAAIAAQCTASFKAQGLKFRTFTFGEPRSGNKAWAKHIDKISGAVGKKAGTYYRVTHTDDGVPHYPHRSLGYYHSKTEYWQRNTKSGGQSAARTYRCFGNEPDNCNNSVKGRGVNRAHSHYSGIKITSGKACGLKKGQ